MPQYDGQPVLTVGKADRTRDVVNDWFNKKGYAGDRPTLHKPGHEGAMWVLSMEGYGDWAVRLAADESVTWPPGVWVEPVASWCLGLYPKN